MPRKTPADRARSSAKFWKKEIEKAYGSGNRSAPIAEAVRWLYAALAQRAGENPDDADDMYKWATDQISGFAVQVQDWIITETEAGKQPAGGE